MIYFNTDDKQHYFEHGKYSNTPLKHVPTEHLDVVIENFHATNNLEKLKSVQICIDYKIKRIQEALDKLNPPDTNVETENVTKKQLIRRR